MGSLLVAFGLFCAFQVIREVLLSREREGWVQERSELLTRIQRPEWTPVQPVERAPRELNEAEIQRATALSRVGTVADA